MQEASDIELITGVQHGNHHAFQSLVVKYQQFAFAVAYRFVGNSMEAEDITQEVFLKLWKNIGKYNPGNKLTTWLYQIITNHCLDHLKSVSRRQQMKSVTINPGLSVTEETAHEKQMDDREMLQIITALARHLTPKQQSVFVLRDLEGLSVEAVCDIMGMKADTVKSNLYYARLKIREGLIKYYSESPKLVSP